MDELQLQQMQVVKKKKSKRRSKKLLLLFLMFGMTMSVLVATTYAWFVGMGNVKVNNFTVNITSEKDLEISLDGYTWNENVTITENTIKAHGQTGGAAYVGNKNSWVGDEGLVPVSSSGDNTGGRLDIYSKSSLTSTGGGFRLVSDKIDNSDTEATHYVAFDIFVKNKSGDVYTEEYNLRDDENIFLTTDSTVTGTASGAISYGIQNSARVAFVQIGRIDLDDLEANTTPVIKCGTPSAGETYTSLCDKYSNVYRTVIWEPNELAHDTKAINYYSTVCKQRTGGTFTYNTSDCTDVTTVYVPAYTVKYPIKSSYYVDIYDGLNSYTTYVQSDSEVVRGLLQSTETYTDTMKATGGHYTLFKLAPHSVTKIRVYVYLEGQDVDNYDLISKDTAINVQFGFTKERTNADQILDDETQVFQITFDNYGTGETANVDVTYNDDMMVWENWINATQNYNSGGIVCNTYACYSSSSTYVYRRTGSITLVEGTKLYGVNYFTSESTAVLKTDKFVVKEPVYYKNINS